MAGEALSDSEKEFFADYLTTIQEYYFKNNAYWAAKNK
jgi:hypothetical protein